MGILAGFALLPAAQAGVTALTATPSTQTFYVDGRQVQFEAYAIHGNNFVKLRDVGKAVDFGVAYDAKTNSVYIDPDAHYQEETPQPVQAAPSPSPSTVTEGSVQDVLAGLRAKYPHGAVYPSPYTSTSSPPYGPTNKTAPGGPSSAPMPPSGICLGEKSTAQAGSRSVPAIWWRYAAVDSTTGSSS